MAFAEECITVCGKLAAQIASLTLVSMIRDVGAGLYEGMIAHPGTLRPSYWYHRQVGSNRNAVTGCGAPLDWNVGLVDRLPVEGARPSLHR